MSQNVESKPNDLVNEIRSVLGADTEVREQAEANITKYANDSTDSFIYSLLDILAGPYEEKDKKSACMWLQKALSTFLQGLPELYFKITPDTRTHFKKRIFEILIAEPSSTIKNSIAEAIGEIAGSVISDASSKDHLPKGEEPWKDFVSYFHFKLIYSYCIRLSMSSSFSRPKMRPLSPLDLRSLLTSSFTAVTISPSMLQDSRRYSRRLCNSEMLISRL